MKKITYRLLFGTCAGLLLAHQSSVAAPALWQTIETAERATADNPQNTFKHRRLMLDEAGLQAIIPFPAGKQATRPVTLSVPLPDGGFTEIELIPNTLMAPHVQARFPNLRTWRVRSDNPAIQGGSAEMTALGFHVMLMTTQGDRWYIEPEQPEPNQASRRYHSFSKRENAQATRQNFSCGVSAQQELSWQPARLQLQRTATDSDQPEPSQRAGETLHTYDLAIAATGEYTQQLGGSSDTAYSAIVTTINRINQIFERDLSLSLRLVTGTETVFNDPETDPYTSLTMNGLITENQEELDKRVGSDNYDIGHVLSSSAGGNGLAFVGVLCNSAYKARGGTSSNILQGDAFSVDYVAHEIGHQLGATHTFNGILGSCTGSQRIQETAMEPGSGNTIMSYGGICFGDNIQTNVDPQFHWASIQQITDLAHNGSGAGCAVSSQLNNSLPRVDAGTNYTIPARTPFILSGSASDSDGDTLAYSWDQVDTGNASNLGVDSGNNALIKSSVLARSGVRNVPDLRQLITTSNSPPGESLPRSDRHMDFRLTVRDGKGGVGSDAMRLTVKDTGERFEVLEPTGQLTAGTHPVVWNVAGTDQLPISCSEVDIAYTNDLGASFTDVLSKTPNDGNATITLSTEADHIRVKCSDNVFFALSGTVPHIATYQLNSDQSTEIELDDLEDDDSGGGGSFPPGLLLFGLLAGLYQLKRSFKS